MRIRSELFRLHDARASNRNLGNCEKASYHGQVGWEPHVGAHRRHAYDPSLCFTKDRINPGSNLCRTEKQTFTLARSNGPRMMISDREQVRHHPREPIISYRADTGTRFHSKFPKETRGPRRFTRTLTPVFEAHNHRSRGWLDGTTLFKWLVTAYCHDQLE